MYRSGVKRTIAAASIALALTLPALVASVWLFGCCVLPFHRAMHRVLPLCHIAAAAHDGAASRQQPSTAPRTVERRIVIRLWSGGLQAAVVRTGGLKPAAPQVSYRSFITLGAMRCDRDVGLHTLLATFII